MREGVARDKERIRLKRKEQQLMQQQKEGVIESRDGDRWWDLEMQQI